MEKSRFSKWFGEKLPMFILFIIRLVETFAVSVVPSILSVIVIFVAPNARSWMVLSVFSFIVTAAGNVYFWLDFVSMRQKVKEFYVINGLVQAIYAGASIICYKWLGYLAYSLTFAGLRGFETFGLKTIQSIIIANCAYFLIMAVCERVGRHHTEKVRAVLKKLGASDKVEIDDKAAALVPTKQEQEIKTLSVEEMDAEIQKDEQEIIEAARMAAQSEPEELWNENMSKGSGEEIKRVDYSVEGTDVDEFDYVPGQENDNGEYGSDSLWNSDIYNGGGPITDYEDEMNEPPPSMQPDDDGLLWDEEFYKRHGAAALDEIYAEEEATAAPEEIAYDADSLWSADFYRGTDKNDIPERMLDFSDEVEMPEQAEELYDYEGPENITNVGTDVYDEEDTETVNPNMEYDADSLWDKDMHLGRK